MRSRPWFLIPIALYLIVIGSVTLGPCAYGSTGSGFLWRLLSFFEGHDSTQWLTFSVVEGLANALMFVPLGMLVALFLPRRLWLLAIALCILLSVGIETFQGLFRPSRVVDVHDVLNNGTGGLVGAVVATVARMTVTVRSRRVRTA